MKKMFRPNILHSLTSQEIIRMWDTRFCHRRFSSLTFSLSLNFFLKSNRVGNEKTRIFSTEETKQKKNSIVGSNWTETERKKERKEERESQEGNRFFLSHKFCSKLILKLSFFLSRFLVFCLLNFFIPTTHPLIFPSPFSFADHLHPSSIFFIFGSNDAKRGKWRE